MDLLDDGGGLSVEYQAHITAALPPGTTMPAEGWADLAEVITGYLTLVNAHATYPIAAERKRWKRIGDAVDVLVLELGRLHRKTLWSDPNPSWARRALKELWQVERKVESRAAFHTTWSAFGGRGNPHRDFLYGGIMRVWTDRLNKKLRCGPPDRGLPTGPLPRFFYACVEPILGNAAPLAGIADIVDRERAARAPLEVAKRNRGL